MNEYVLSAFIFGITAGFSPGPLSIIVVQQTLEKGLRNGLKASLAPMITDGPIIAVTLLVLTRLKNINIFIGILSLIGGLYLLWLSFKMIRMKKLPYSKTPGTNTSLNAAIKVNFLNPNPYLFWFTVGGTYILLGTKLQSMIFVSVGISTLICSKMFIAFITSRFRKMLESYIYLFIMKLLGIGMAIFGITFFIKSYNVLFFRWF